MQRRINRTFGGYCLKFSLLEHLRDASSSGTDAEINSSGALELDSVWHAWIKYSRIVQIHSLQLEERKRTYFVRWSAYCFCSTVLPACCRLQPVSTCISLSLSSLYICVLHVFLYLLHRIWFVSEFDAFSVELKFVNRIDRKLKLQYSVN